MVASNPRLESSRRIIHMIENIEDKAVQFVFIDFIEAWKQIQQHPKAIYRGMNRNNP